MYLNFSILKSLMNNIYLPLKLIYLKVGNVCDCHISKGINFFLLLI